MLFTELDWPQIISKIESEARTIYGKDQVRVLLDSDAWAQDRETAMLHQQETSDVMPLLERESLWGPLRDLPEVHVELELLERGGILEQAGFVKIRQWLIAMDAWCQFPKEHLGKVLKKDLETLFDPFDPLRQIGRVLDVKGELREDASPKLRGLFQSIRDLKVRIHQQMDQLLKDYSEQGVLQEKFMDQRSGRFVLPVRVSDQSKVPGQMTEYSVSKQTIYIEPEQVGRVHAELKRKEYELSEEIYRIFTELSDGIRPFIFAIKSSIEILSHWDAVYARGKFSRSVGGKGIELTDEEWNLQDCANPMLFFSMAQDQVIRNTISFAPPRKMILISGPNTGGKTVFLKTMGLACVFSRTGLFLPGVGRILVPFFKHLFVDLGDPQSIESHLSSFSGHVLKMKKILTELQPKSLILVDEMNSATDPMEGSALAEAFVEEVLSVAEVCMVATTHDPGLKALGMKDERILSASILFEESSLKPTYRMVFGAPGRSRALETAERYGMPKEIIERARSKLSTGHLTLERALEQIQSEQKRAEQFRHEAMVLKDQAEKMKEEYEKKLRETLTEVLEKGRSKLKHMLELAQIELRETVRKLQSAKSHKATDEIRSELNQAFLEGEDRIQKTIAEAVPEFKEWFEPTDQKIQKFEAQVGDWVRVPKWKNVGEVVEWDGKRARVQLGPPKKIQSGLGSAFQVWVFPMEMESLSATERKQIESWLGRKLEDQASRVNVKSEEVGLVPDQIDVRGKRFEETELEVKHYLDRAFRSGRSEVTVIHGLGTGALREGLRDWVKGLNFVTGLRDAGSAGATKVLFYEDRGQE